MSTTLAVSAVISVLSAATFFLAGRAVLRRPVSPTLTLARNAFSIWWFGLAGVTLAGAAQVALVGFYQSNLNAYLTMSILLILGLCVSLWGLVYYLLFLFTNKRGLHWPLGVAYLVFFFWVVYLILSADLQGLKVGRWTIEPVYAHPLEESPQFQVLIAALIGPEFLGALAYLSLYFRVHDPLQRRRVLLVGLSILFWFGSAWAASLVRLEMLVRGLDDTWQVVSRLIGLAAAATVYYAYAHLKARPGPPVADAAQAPAAPEAKMGDGPERRAAHV